MHALSSVILMQKLVWEVEGLEAALAALALSQPEMREEVGVAAEKVLLRSVVAVAVAM